jgi:hypothetical protein
MAKQVSSRSSQNRVDHVDMNFSNQHRRNHLLIGHARFTHARVDVLRALRQIEGLQQTP